ncbi:tetraacyldisaccharide 4'-kinase [Thalassobaculum fulvum]|uniref:Tetraacyldisaccharide 4'-kinase n=1 Tax=Thalassobaculum fulvum TaxID=1633335 RepID=A0A918XUD5_9PROT|nr:tetraacyldisaccharide 4'-kinase [Thalassobaculum fulvum]GHD55157.1 tetraacyldisaccharide 4'-kinase [Thalassobaculum fulvum]
MRAPGFWAVDGRMARLLAPLSTVWTAAGRARRRYASPYRPAVPLICVGNAVAGGAGKTPVALALAAELKDLGLRVGFLSRGHGGSERGPLRVDPAVHDAAAVGDEPLLLARSAVTVIARDRAVGARFLEGEGADVIVMDDGLQNPTVAPTASLLVVDGGAGFGNGRVMPAGPLREPLDDALARVDAVAVVGEDRAGVADALAGARPVMRGLLEPLPGTERFAGTRVLGFAGIGRPAKFAETLREVGAEVVEFVEFPDHHRWDADEVMELVERARELDATPVTTEKDAVRLPAAARDMVEVFPVALVWRDPAPVTAWLRRVVGL